LKDWLLIGIGISIFILGAANFARVAYMEWQRGTFDQTSVNYDSSLGPFFVAMIVVFALIGLTLIVIGWYPHEKVAA